MYKYIDFKNQQNYSKLKNASNLIKNGNIVVFPTETVYGIGTNGFDEKAIKKLYEIKKRPFNKPISLLVNSIEMINTVTKNITNLEYGLIKNFFPGPLTIILEKKEIVPDILTANSNMVGIRMPANKLCLDLISYAGIPIATSSANISGKANGIILKDIIDDLGKQVDCFIDGGICKNNVASTVVQVINGIPHILRQGVISKQEIEEFCLNYIRKCRP